MPIPAANVAAVTTKDFKYGSKNNDFHQHHGDPRISYIGLALVFLTPALGGFLYGYDIGATSFVLAMLRRGGDSNRVDSMNQSNLLVDDDDDALFLQQNRAGTSSSVWWDDYFGVENTDVKNNTNDSLQEGLFISAISLGALLGSHLVLFHLAVVIGRRMELRVAAFLYLIGSLCNIASGTILAHSKLLGWPLLLLGRTIFGVGIGFVMHGAPNYMAEMAPSHIRGAIVSAKESLIVLGIVVGYAVGDGCFDATTSNHKNGGGGGGDWTVLYQVSFLLSVPMLCLTFLVPRSFRWLLLQHHQRYRQQHKPGYIPDQSTFELGDETDSRINCPYRREAKVAMQFLYRDDVTIEFNHMVYQTMISELRTLQSTPATEGDANCCGTLGALFTSSPSITSSLLVALGLLCFQEGSGQPAVLSYATVIFEEAGWGGNASVFTASLMLCVSIVTVFLVDRVGRKRLLQICAAIMGTALLILSFKASSISNAAAPEWERILVLVSLFVYISGYQLGFGPITWLVVAEVFPAHVRGQASALAVEFKYILNFVVQFGVPIFQGQFGWPCTFGVFGSLMAVAAIYFIPTYVVETKGLSLEQIEAKATACRHNSSGSDITETGRTAASTVVANRYSCSTGSSSFRALSSSDVVDDDEQSTGTSLLSEASHLLSELASPRRANHNYVSISV